jgi:hypothetical protein
LKATVDRSGFGRNSIHGCVGASYSVLIAYVTAGSWPLKRQRNVVQFILLAARVFAVFSEIFIRFMRKCATTSRNSRGKRLYSSCVYLRSSLASSSRVTIFARIGYSIMLPSSSSGGEGNASLSVSGAAAACGRVSASLLEDV